MLFAFSTFVMCCAGSCITGAFSDDLVHWVSCWVCASSHPQLYFCCSITWFESTRHSYILPYPGFHYHCLALIDKSWIIMWRPGCNWGEGLWSNHTECIFINLLQFSFSVYIQHVSKSIQFFPSCHWSMQCMTPCLVLGWVSAWETGCWCKILCAYMTIPHSVFIILTNKVKHVVLSILG